VVIDPGHGGGEIGRCGCQRLGREGSQPRCIRAGPTGSRRQGLYRRPYPNRRLPDDVGLPSSDRGGSGSGSFLSVHHNGDPNGHSDQPGAETFYQAESSDSRRLGGLIYEGALGVFSQWPETSWHANVDAGVEPRLNDQGEDFFGVLRLTGEVTTVMSEGLFLWGSWGGGASSPSGGPRSRGWCNSRWCRAFPSN